MVGDHVLLNAKNLPTNVVSAVFKTELLPLFIGPFTVVAKKGLAYTLSLPRKSRTHPRFYVGLLKPYRDPSHANLEALAPQNSALPSAAKSKLGAQAEPSSGLDPIPTPERELVSRRAQSGSYSKFEGDHSVREAPFMLLLRYTELQ